MRILFLSAVLGIFGLGPAGAQPVLSIVFEQATIVDGSGGPPYQADLGVTGGRVAAIGSLGGYRATRRVDARGLILAPGFIDIHSHAVGRGPGGPLDLRPDAENLVRQGVTSVFGGQDGSSPILIGEALAHFDSFPSAVNVGMFVGHGSIRARVIGESNVSADSTQLLKMARHIALAMADGAFGLSSGLEYTPGMFASTAELAFLASATAPYGGLYISHVRDEGGRLMESVEELIKISRLAKTPAQLTHHKIIGKGRWGGTQASLDRVVEARAEGVDITLDVYPYTASSTGMTILFPAWAKDGGLAALQERLRVPEDRSRIRAEVIDHINIERGGDPTTIVAANCSFDSSLAGKSLADMSLLRGLPADVPSAADVAIDLVLRGSCQGVFHSMSEEDVIRVMRSPHAMVASDGGSPELGVGSPHPRSYGTFARVLGRYVRDLGILTLPEAVARLSGRPAARLGLVDRGQIAIGSIADLAIFDPNEIRDVATFSTPHQMAQGMKYVLVRGVAVLWDGDPTGARPGRALRKTD